MNIFLQHSNYQHLKAEIKLPASKSESNRALIINALSGNQLALGNISEARDTVTMQRLLAANELELNVLDAGTTMRFLTAFCVATHRNTVLTGSSRMKERPIAILVDALRSLGASIVYTEKEGFPPIHIQDFVQKTNQISIRGNVSSQYISALLMIAPILPQGLNLTLTEKIGSRPYIEMTLSLLQNFGIQHQWQTDTISIKPQNYRTGAYQIESDWSAASYWYAIAALAETADITLLGLKQNSLQGDSVVAVFMEHFGVETTFLPEGVQLKKHKNITIKPFEADFSHCPDIAQTFAVVCAAKGVSASLTGLESLIIKETDRIAALITELANFGIKVQNIDNHAISIAAQTLTAPQEMIKTYKDHRMAMAFAPLALRFPIKIEQAEVVEKSYPHFWDDLQIAQFIYSKIGL